MPKSLAERPQMALLEHVSSEVLINHLAESIRRIRLQFNPDPPPVDKQNRLEALLLSIRSEREVRLTEEDWPDIRKMPADAYLYDPRTHTLKETN
jgi:hypothetical protein